MFLGLIVFFTLFFALFLLERIIEWIIAHTPQWVYWAMLILGVILLLYSGALSGQ